MPPCTTWATSSARTCASATRSSSSAPARSSRPWWRRFWRNARPRRCRGRCRAPARRAAGRWRGRERSAAKGAQKTLENTRATTSRPLGRILFGRGIRHVGERLAEALATAFGSMDRLMAASTEELLAVEGVGPEIAASVQAYFAEPRNRALVDKLRAAGVRLSEERASTAGPLAGLGLVVTGRLEHSTRPAIEERIRQLGGIVGDSVTKKTSYVIVGADAGSKADKAARLGVPILSEQAFEALVAERSRPGTTAD